MATVVVRLKISYKRIKKRYRSNNFECRCKQTLCDIEWNAVKLYFTQNGS